NAGDEPARDVRPEVIYEHQTYSGEAAALDPGARREWQIPLAPPAAPGTFAATVRIHYVDALGRGSVPVVIQVPAPDGSPGPVRPSPGPPSRWSRTRAVGARARCSSGRARSWRRSRSSPSPGGARAPGPPGIARPAPDWHCVSPTPMRRLPATLTLAAGLLVLPAVAAARSAGDPIRLVWDEGDVAGTSTIYG